MRGVSQFGSAFTYRRSSRQGSRTPHPCSSSHRSSFPGSTSRRACNTQRPSRPVRKQQSETDLTDQEISLSFENSCQCEKEHSVLTRKPAHAQKPMRDTTASSRFEDRL
jgi:hypothetical protein